MLYYVDANDTQPDIVTLDRTNDKAHFWRNNGSASFSLDTASDQSVPIAPWSITNVPGSLIAPSATNPAGVNAINVDSSDKTYVFNMDTQGNVGSV
ncbi:MAG: hypothetical protein R8K53_01345, partial [Mariprofundaceae bacterium]